MNPLKNVWLLIAILLITVLSIAVTPEPEEESDGTPSPGMSHEQQMIILEAISRD